MLKPACFLDRDGVINIDRGYVYKKEDFEWVSGAKEAIRYLNKQKYCVFIVTNQSGISRGLYTEKDVEILHNLINEDLKKENAFIDEFFYSPYHPDFPDRYNNLSNLRKPNVGMLELADKKWKIDKINSFLIGDKEIDLQCAKNFGIDGYIFKSGNLKKFIENIKATHNYKL